MSGIVAAVNMSYIVIHKRSICIFYKYGNFIPIEYYINTIEDFIAFGKLVATL